MFYLHQYDQYDHPFVAKYTIIWGCVGQEASIPLCLSTLANLWTQSFKQIPHKNLENHNVHGWLLESQPLRNKDTLMQWW